MPLDLVRLVWQKQPNLRRVEIGSAGSSSIGISYNDVLETLAETHFTKPLELVISPNTADVASAGSSVLSKFKIDGLVVHGLIWSEGDAYRAESNGDSESDDSKVHDKLTTALFSHRHPVHAWWYLQSQMGWPENPSSFRCQLAIF